MNANEAWNKFILNGSPLMFIEYSQLKAQEANNAKNNQSSCNKSYGCQGK